MKQQKVLPGLLAAAAMLTIILDTKTAITSATEGVALCLRTVIPSLFPFFVLSGIVNSSLLGQNIPMLRPLKKLCKIPRGSESLMLLGYISGYPVGAQLITQAYRQGKLSVQSARRMLGFCSNAGPAFLFGMLSALFDGIGIIWLLWGIHIISSLIVGMLLPAEDNLECEMQPCQPVSFAKSLQSAVAVMASVCGCVVAFRVVIGFCNRWFLWLFPNEIQVLLSGLIELSNGCALLMRISSAGMRFILASVMLSFGGLCVYMQTISVTQELGCGYYLPGKVLQASLSFIMSFLLQMKLYTGVDRVSISVAAPLLWVICALIMIYFILQKKSMAFGRKVLYNRHI